jgi:hypothetical protein
MRRSLGQTEIASEDALLPVPCADGADVRESESRLRQVVESAESVFILYQLHPPAYLYISPNCSTLLGLDVNRPENCGGSAVRFYAAELASPKRR